MSVELKVTLVGEDPQQQAAFNNPTVAPQPSHQSELGPSSQTARSQAPINPVVMPQPTTRESFPTVQHKPLNDTPEPTPKATAKASREPSPKSPSPAARITKEDQLIDSIDELIDAINRLTSVETNQPHPQKKATGSRSSQSSKPDSFFDRIASSIDRKMKSFGMSNTSIGKRKATSIGRNATTVATAPRSSPPIGTVTGLVTGGAGVGGSGAGVAGGTSAGAASTGAAGGIPVAGALVGLAAGAGALAYSFKKLMESVERTAADLADLSPDIAIGRAQHEVKMELMRLDRSKRIGPELAGLDQAQSRLAEASYEVQTKIYELLMKASPVMEFGTDSLTVMVRLIEVLVARVNDIYAWWTDDPTDDKPAADALKAAQQSLFNALQELLKTTGNQQQNPIDPMFQAVMKIDLNQLNPQKGNP